MNLRLSGTLGPNRKVEIEFVKYFDTKTNSLTL